MGVRQGLLNPQEPGTPSQGAPYWPAYLPESVKLGSFGDAELARLVLADEIVVHSFPIDQGQRVCTLLLPGPQPEGRGRVSPHSNGGLPVPQFSLPTHMLHTQNLTKQ